jgi:hypothetical protein
LIQKNILYFREALKIIKDAMQEGSAIKRRCVKAWWDEAFFCSYPQACRTVSHESSICLKNPVPGKVKTLLAHILGADKTLEVYRKLLSYTHDITKELEVDKFLFYTDFIDENDLWKQEYYLRKAMIWNERMKPNFPMFFSRLYPGSNDPELKDPQEYNQLL